MAETTLWAVFAAVVAAVFGGYWFFVLLPETRETASFRRRLKSEDPVQAQVRLLKQTKALSDIGGLNALLVQFEALSGPLRTTIDRSGLQITVGMLVLICTSSSLLATLVTHVYVPIWTVAVAVGAVIALVPIWVVKTAGTMRMRKFEEQFPEAIDLIARAMRAGHAFSTGLKMAADELPAPSGPEFRILYERQNYGAQLPDALKSFADRVQSLDARFFVTAVLTQREAGGNLAEVLDRLSAVMRERFKIKREVRVRSAHGRITAWVLAGMPPGLAFLMAGSSPEQLRVLVTDPTGIKLVITAVVLQILGVLVVRKLVDIEY